MNRVLVLGIGNLLMGDEGVGVEAVRRLQGGPLPPGVTLLDGGTGSFQLLSWFGGQDAMVLIDASADAKPPGTVSLLEPRFASDFPRSLTAHDIGLRDLIEAASLLGALPRVFLVTISVGELQSMRIGLSDAVTASLPRVVEQVQTLLEGLAASPAEAAASV